MQQERGDQSQIVDPSAEQRQLSPGLSMTVIDQDGVTYYSLSSETEDSVGGFEVARLNEGDLDDPQVRFRWKTPEGFGNAPMMAGAYIEGVEKAVMGENFGVDNVDGCVGTLMTAYAEISLNRAPHLSDFEHMNLEAIKNGSGDIQMFKYKWPGGDVMPRGEMWLANERLTVRSYIEPSLFGESGVAAVSEFFNSTALYPEYTQDFSAVLHAVFTGDANK